MKSVISAIIAFSGLVVFGETFRTNNVEGLVYLLKRYSEQSHTIELESGDYHLREDLNWFTNSSTYVSHLYTGKIHLKGVGANPEDTRLIGDGAFRIVHTTASSKLENLTITNGYAKTRTGYSNSGRAGGVYGGAIVTNCIVIGNNCDAYGGGGAGGVKFHGSWIINNRANNAGGGFHGSTAMGSKFIGNVAKNSGGAVYTASLVDCEIISNRTELSYGGGGYNVTSATNCLFAYNHSADVSNGGGGGVANGASSDNSANRLYNCNIVSNTSAGNGGGAFKVTIIGGSLAGNVAASSSGAAYYSNIFDCDVAFNVANKGNAGGISSSYVSNCTIRANICSNVTSVSYGGGLYKCSAVYDSEIYWNCARTCKGVDGANKVGTAGGVYDSTLYRCNIHDNFSDSYGGGVRASTLIDCILANNCAGNDGLNAHSSILKNCDVSGSGVYSCTADSTVFHDINRVVSLTGNPYQSTNQPVYHIWKGSLYATNCLFYSNGKGDDNYGFYLFQYAVSVKQPSFFVNCTVVSNVYGNLFNNLKEDYPLTVENSVFFGNKNLNGVEADISVPELSSNTACENGGLYFRNSAYGTYRASNGIDIYMAGSMYRFGIDGFPSDPKFMGGKDTEHPFSLRRTSPLIGKGVHGAWMEGAYDIRGEGYPRANGTSVDLGCYQCWLNPIGTVFSIR